MYEVPKYFPTTIVGSYPKIPPAEDLIRKRKKCSITEEEFHELVKPSIKAVMDDYLHAGVDILSDGEQAREDMVAYFAERLNGYKGGEWVRIFDSVYFRKPVIVGEIEYIKPMAVMDWVYASSVSMRRPVKAILTGPYTMADWSFDLFYGDRRELVIALAKVIRREVEEFLKKGAKYVQIDEPALSTRPLKEEVDVVNEALHIIFDGIKAKKIVHICFGKIERILEYLLDFPIDQFDFEFKNSNFRLLPYLVEYEIDKELGYGVIDVHSTRVEEVQEIFNDIEKLVKTGIIGPEKIYVDPDCGLKRLPRGIAVAKLENMVKAAKLAREKLV
ncbi:MAG: methionine synthase [Desulfurococcales archaeon]|nr:methionine synthase [Desulfurococcales archaeon]